MRIRSNVTSNPASWELVPGELLERWNPRMLDRRGGASKLQRDQHMYHQSCGCGRRLFEIEVFGCNECPWHPTVKALEERERAWRRTMQRIHELERREQLEIERARTGRDDD